jgi:hypothetical protein
MIKTPTPFFLSHLVLRFKSTHVTTQILVKETTSVICLRKFHYTVRVQIVTAEEGNILKFYASVLQKLELRPEMVRRNNLAVRV